MPHRIAAVFQHIFQAQSRQDYGVELHDSKCHGGYTEFIEIGQIVQKEIGESGSGTAKAHQGENRGGYPQKERQSSAFAPQSQNAKGQDHDAKVVVYLGKGHITPIILIDTAPKIRDDEADDFLGMKAPALRVGFIQSTGASSLGESTVFHRAQIGIHHRQSREPESQHQ